MKRGLLCIGTLAGAIGAASQPAIAGVTPMTYDFTYQGRLDIAGVPYNGTAQMEFRIFDSLVGGAVAPAPAPPVITVPAIAVVQGTFTVTLNFGNTAFVGDQRFLEIRVDTTAPFGDVYTTLTPRRLLTSTPYAAFALGVNGATITGLNASNLATGTVPGARVAGAYGNAVNFSNAGNAFTGTFTGSGAALTTLNATNISSGTVADARLSANVALLNTAQTFTAAKTFTADLLFGNDDVSLIFPATAVPSSPMIHMFASGTGNGPRMVIGHGPSNPQWGLKYTDTTDTFRFQNSDAGAAALAIELFSGDVGIGTDTPLNALHVERAVTGGTPLMLLNNLSDAPTGLTLSAPFQTWLIGQNVSPDGGFIDDFYIHDVNTGVTKFMIDDGAGGNVGIGTLAPVSKLQVAGGDITLESTVDTARAIRTAYDIVLSKDIDNDNAAAWLRVFGDGDTIEQFRISDGDEASLLGDGTFSSNGIDYAEAFKALDASLEPGDVVSLAVGQWEHATRSPGAYDPHIIGVVSTKPAFCAGMSFDQEESINPELTAQRNAARAAGDVELERELTEQMTAAVKQAYRPIALAGRVPCKVDGQYGPIKAGDRITSSATAGCAMVQTQAGQSIGIALQDYNGAGIGSIIVLVQPGWHGGTAAGGGVDPVAALLNPSTPAAETADLRARVESLEALVNQLMKGGN